MDTWRIGAVVICLLFCGGCRVAPRSADEEDIPVFVETEGLPSPKTETSGLEYECPDCQGGGFFDWVWVKGKDFPTAMHSYKDSTEEVTWATSERCGTCNGTGKALTKKGRAAMRFLKRHENLLSDDSDDEEE